MEKFIQANVDFMKMMFRQTKEKHPNPNQSISSINDPKELKAWDSGYCAGHRAAAEYLEKVFDDFCLKNEVKPPEPEADLEVSL